MTGAVEVPKIDAHGTTAPGVDTGAMMVDVGLRAASETLVGRVAEMSLLGRAMDSALVDGSAIVLIAGEAGVGKTRLVQELAAEAGQRHFRVGMGRCIDLGETIWPLAPLRDLVGGLIDELDAEALDLVLGSARAALSELVPELGDVASDAAPLTSEQLCELVVGMFVRLTQRGPLLFVVEDLHWADPTTRMLFTALAGVARIRPLLLVGTFRSDELHRRHPLRPTLAEIERSPRCQRMSLEPLDQWETALLIDALDPTASERAYPEVVHRRSGGNPFFVEELVAARRTGVETVPETLRDVILARAAVLDDRDMAVLGAAAAAGETSAEVLAAATGLQAGELDAVLARLRAGAQLARTDSVRFRHELAREVFYDELLPGERTRLHADLARSLEAHSPDRLGEIAHHWRAAHDGGRALPAHVAAGRQALRAGGAAEAEAHLAHALDLWEGISEARELCDVGHVGLLVLAAEAAEHAGHMDRAIELDLRAVAELSAVDPVREGEAWLELRDLYRFESRYADCAHAMERALALIPADPPSRARARALARAAFGEYHARRPARALQHASEAIIAAEAIGDPDIVIDAYDALCAAHALRRDTAEALLIAQANLDRCRAGTPVKSVLAAHHALIDCLRDVGRHADVPPLARHGIALARDSGLGGPRGSWMAINLLHALVDLGRWTDAEQARAEHADLLEHSSVAGELGATWGVALVHQGRLAEARPLIELTRATFKGSDWPEDRAFFVGAVALFDAADGRPAEAVALVDEYFSRSTIGLSFGDPYVLSIGMTILADAACGDRHHPASAAPEARALATAWTACVDASYAATEHLTPLDQLHREQAELQADRLGGHAHPDRWMRLADGWSGLGYRYEEAAARLRAADHHLAGPPGRSPTARRAATEQLALAHDLASDLPTPPLLARIDDLARRAHLSVGSARAPATDGLGLTRREYDVLCLVAEGRSNGQIARELFISTKTASVHVSNILRKLGVTNRREAADYARLHGVGR